MKGKNILVLAPHTDDGELGCGASIVKYISEGCHLSYAAFSSCSQSLPAGFAPDTLVDECKKATAVLGISQIKCFDFEVRKFPQFRQDILETMVKLNQEIKPDIVLLPSKNDIHQDHKIIFEEGCRAFKNTSLLGYELPWNSTGFQPNYFERISESQLDQKIKSLKEYKTQAHRNYMNEDFTRSLAIVRGVQCNSALAEAFEVYKLIS